MATSRPDDIPASAWVARFAPQVPAGTVLDLAAGSGRHSLLMRGLGHAVVAVDRDTSTLAARAVPGIDAVAEDLETGSMPACLGRRYAAVIVTNYLHRPILPAIVGAVAPGGWLLYETFAIGNERFGRPSNPGFLLRPGELLEAVRGILRVVAYEDLEVAEPRPAMVQRIAARAA
jgi:SAM-dependent methyltransferase